MRRLAPLAAAGVVLGAAITHAAGPAPPSEGAPASAPRLVIWVPEAGGSLAGPLTRAFGGGALLLDAARLAERLPPSPEARARVAREAEIEGLLAAAEKAFGETRFPAAAAALGRATALLDEAPPSVRNHAAWVRARLLAGRVDLAEGRTAAAAAAFADAAGAAPEAQLDEGEYPPEVRRAYQAARQRVVAAPPRTVRVESVPPGAEVELNGRLWGRTPATLKLPPGRCRLVVTHPGFAPYVAACGVGRPLTVRLVRADAATRRDQLRERLQSDPRWFFEPLLLEALAAEVGARWVLVLERGRGEQLEARLYWVLKRAFRPLVPARFGSADLGELAAAVREIVAAAEGLEARVVDPLTRAPVLEARAGDPAVIAGAALYVRPRGAPAYRRVPLEGRPGGRYAGAVPADLCGAPGTAVDLEYYVEGYGPGGEVRSRVGDAAHPARFGRAALPLVVGGPGVPRVPGWYTRWYVWAGVAAVVVGMSIGGYFAFRPTDVAITFGGR